MWNSLMYWETIHNGSLGLACLMSRGIDSFYSRFPFQGWLCNERLGKIEIVTPPTHTHTLERRAGLFAAQCNKDYVSLQGKSWVSLLAADYERLGDVWAAVVYTCWVLSIHSRWSTLSWGDSRAKWKPQEHEGRAACCAWCHKLLCLWPRHLMASGSLCNTVAGLFAGVQVG